MEAKTYSKLGILVIIIAILLRIFLSSMHTISGDACWHFSAARFIADNSNFPLFEKIGRDEPFWAPPLFHVIASFFYNMFGEFGFKLVPLIFGSLALIFSYLIFKKFLDPKGTFYAALFMSFIPINIDYSVLGYSDSILPFFVVLSIYLALKDKFMLSGVAAGLAVLAKYNGVFVIPVLLYIAYRRNKEKISSLLSVSVLPIIVSLPWLVRNWILLGNPIWPFMNFIFHGYQLEDYSGFSLENLSSLSTYAITYLGFFGVPDGHYRAFFFFDIPYIGILMAVFVLATLIFILPIFFGFKNDKNHRIFHIMLASFGMLFLLFELNVRPAVSRILLPSMFAFAFIYGFGMNSIMEKKKIFGKVLAVAALLIAFGFVSAEIFKFKAATDSWNIYKNDFDWVKKNTEKNSILLFGGQCVHYRTERPTLFPSSRYFDANADYDYIWLNQDFRLEPQSVLSEDNFKKIESEIKNKKVQLVYENSITNTEVYQKIKK